MSKRGWMKRTNVWLTNNQTAKLEALAERTGLKKSEHIRRAIDYYIEKLAQEKAKENEK